MSPRPLKKERKFITFRLLEQDRELLQKLGLGRRDVPDRYTALCEAAKLVAELDLPNIKDQERRPLRLGLPPELVEAVTEKAEATGQPFLTVLLAAAREYRHRWPLEGKTDPPEVGRKVRK